MMVLAGGIGFICGVVVGCVLMCLCVSAYDPEEDKD